MNPPTWDDILFPEYRERRRPAARHRADRPSVHARATGALTTARDALRDAWRGTDTPAGGLALLTGLQRQGRAS